jgi:hypothetical protein
LTAGELQKSFRTEFQNGSRIFGKLPHYSPVQINLIHALAAKDQKDNMMKFFKTLLALAVLACACRVLERASPAVSDTWFLPICLLACPLSFPKSSSQALKHKEIRIKALLPQTVAAADAFPESASRFAGLEGTPRNANTRSVCRIR